MGLKNYTDDMKIDGLKDNAQLNNLKKKTR
jgi:hypothetical protein